MVKYQTEIDQMIREAIYEPWMSEAMYQEVLSELNIDYLEMSTQIDVGISNGYTLDQQINLIRHFYNS